MNINLQEHEARLSELIHLIEMSKHVKGLFKDVDEPYGKEQSEKYIEQYSERLTEFFKTTFSNANVIGNLTINK